jgi:hypothetical protein
MRFTISSVSAVSLIAALLTPGTVLAQTIPSSFRFLERSQEVGLYGGYMSADAGRFDFAPTGGTLLGARYGVELAGPLSFEGTVGVIDGTRNVIDPSRPEGSRAIGEADVLITTIDARFRFSFPGKRSWRGFSPFMTASGGVAIDSSPETELDEALLAGDVFDFGTSFFTSLGFGTRWFVTRRMAVRADAAFSLWKVDTPPGFSDPARGFLGVSEGEWLGGNAFTVTLLYRW